MAEWRLIKDAAGQTDEDDAAWSSGFKDAFKDWRTYVFAAIFHCVLVLTSVQNFFVSVSHQLSVSCTLFTTDLYSSARVAHCRKHSRIREDCDAPSHSAALRNRHRAHHPEQLLCRSPAKLVVSRHDTNGDSYCRLRHWSSEPQRRSTILRHGVDDRGRPWIQCGCHCVGR